ncbi:PD-(D/E)XK nuclease family protein [Campylobacter pinnipediorum]|uniref:PD-(D/E)XK nuclease family protein n=1 Tax=Campylobacter pinnipediorum TaxID=1965231 RepID=UPI00084D8BF3
MYFNFIYLSINPQSEYYQDELFLSKFIKALCMQDFRIDCKSIKVYKEYNIINIFVTDNYKHITIENKIYIQDKKYKYSDILKA